MSLAKTLLTLGFAASAVLPAVNALGCYNEAGFGEINGADFTFSMLHSDSNQFGSAEERDIRDELLGDIKAWCGKSRAPKSSEANRRTNAPTGHTKACTKECPTSVVKEKASSVYYKVAHDHKDNEVRTMTYQTCYDGFSKGSADCPRGGESEHAGFWFKIDPNRIACDAKGIF